MHVSVDTQAFLLPPFLRVAVERAKGGRISEETPKTATARNTHLPDLGRGIGAAVFHYDQKIENN